jgi:hypothetical protein
LIDGVYYYSLSPRFVIDTWSIKIIALSEEK